MTTPTVTVRTFKVNVPITGKHLVADADAAAAADDDDDDDDDDGRICFISLQK